MKPYSFGAAFVGIAALAGVGHADEVELYLADMLDNVQAGYCLDIGGGKERGAKINKGLQGHTCYSPSGKLGIDQAFDKEKISEGLLYISAFDVCAEVNGTATGTLVELAACDASIAQSFVLTSAGTISPAAAPDMCMTLGAETRSGRSPINQIKVLSLESCSVDQSAYQTWAMRSSLEK